MAPFQHYPLATPSTIRLIHLPPLEDGHDPETAEIRFGIGSYEMKDVAKKYIALSYLWGDATTLHPIRMGGQDFKVTSNLLYFLRHRRDKTLTLRFWIDALCIDQQNNDEKSQQIPRMRQIYENASMVHAELGPATGEEEQAVAAMKTLSQSLLLDNSAQENKVQINLPEEFFIHHDINIFSAIDRIFSHPWWTRAWIMQEATAIPKTCLHFGTKVLQIREALLTNVAIACITHQDLWPQSIKKLPKLPTPQWNVSRISELMEQRTSGKEIAFLKILDAFRGVGATDPRDIVYAALNLTNDLEKGFFKPDYNKPVTSVYRDVPVYHISTSSIPLDVLGFCGSRFQDLEVAKGSASRIPQWNERYPILKIPVRQNGHSESNKLMYNAAPLDQVPSQGFHINTPVIHELTLKVSGIFIDSVSALSAPCLNLGNSQLIENVSQWLTGKVLSVNPSDIVNPNDIYFSGETVMDAFLRTVAIDMDGSKEEYIRGGAAKWDYEKSCFESPKEDRHRWLTFVRYRRLAVTEQKYLGLVPHQALIGDRVYALFGGTVLYVLRPQGDKFWLIGECYVHGLMDGEVISWLKDGRAKIEDISIV